MASMLRAHPLARWTRLTGALLATVGLTLTAVPLAATAVGPTTKPVTVEVLISDQDSSVPLAGAVVSLRAQPSGHAAGTATTGHDGRATLQVDPAVSSQYTASAEWPGGTDDAWWATIEFVAATADVVTLHVEHSYRFVSGRITATDGAEPLADLTGGTVVLSRGSAALQTLALAADGTFRSTAVPTIAADDYRLTFTPPAGYALLEGDPVNPAFSLPADVADLVLAREFSVAPLAPPTPTPSATPTPTPTPTPSATPTAAPTPAPAPAAPAVVLPAAGLAAGLNSISERSLQALLVATGRAGAGNVVPITNGLGQVLGLASQPRRPVAQQVAGLIAPVMPAAPGVSVTGISLTAMDIETALMLVQSQRATLLEEQLKAQILEVKNRNDQIGRLDAAATALQAYVGDPTAARFDNAAAAVRAAGVTDAFLSTTAQTGKAAATALVPKLRGMIDAAGNSQQMDMLRLQSMSNKRNEAFDVMTDFVKKMQESRSSIIGNMRSTPVAIGTVQWNRGAVAGGFNLTGVPNGNHHLILNFADAGVTVITDVDVQRKSLAATGGQMGPTLGIGVGLLLLGLAAVVGAPALRRREPNANVS